MSYFHLIRAAVAASLLGSVCLAQNYNARFYVDINNATPGQGDTWDSAFNYLQDGIAAARGHLLSDSGPVEVWVAQGVYRPDRDIGNPNGSLDPSQSFRLYDDISMFGGFQGNETSISERVLFDSNTQSYLSGDLGAGNTSSFHVVEGSFAGGNVSDTIEMARLDGFTVIGGGRLWRNHKWQGRRRLLLRVW